MSDTEQTLVMDEGMPQEPESEEEEQGQPRRRSRAARLFAIDNLVPIALGAIIAVFFYKVVLEYVIPQTADAWLGDFWMQFKVKFTGRGFIPYICTWLLFWDLSHVVMRYFLRVKPEFGVIAQDIIPAGANELTDEDIESITQSAIETEMDCGGTLLTRRILLAVAHLGIRRDTAELGDLLRRRADADRARAVSAYAFPNFLFWAIPIFGFIGTVMGIGEAVGQIQGALGQVEDTSALTTGITGIAGGLALAFDTTLVALAMSVIAYFAQTFVRQQESRLLADVEDYLTYRLQSRIKTESQDQRIEKVLDSSLASLQELQERIHEEARDRTAVTLQTIMSAQQNITDSLGRMPELLKESADQSSRLIEETRLRLENVGEVAGAKLAEAFGTAVENMRGDLTQMREHVMRGVADASDKLLNEAIARFRQAVAGVESSLVDVSGKLEAVIGKGGEISKLQQAMNENVDALNRVHRLDAAFEELKLALEALRPVLDKMSQPVPIRLSLGGRELERVRTVHGGRS